MWNYESRSVGSVILRYIHVVECNWNVKWRIEDRETECGSGGVKRFIEQTIPLM